MCKANCSGDLRVPPVERWSTKIGTPFVDTPFSSSKRVSSWSHRTRTHHWHLDTKTSLADRSEERRLCSQVRETRRSAVSLVQMTKKIVFLSLVSTVSVRAKSRPVYLAIIHSINYTGTKLTTRGKNLFDSSKRYVATKKASHSNCRNGTLSSSLNHSNCSRLTTELKNKITGCRCSRCNSLYGSRELEVLITYSKYIINFFWIYIEVFYRGRARLNRCLRTSIWLSHYYF